MSGPATVPTSSPAIAVEVTMKACRRRGRCVTPQTIRHSRTVTCRRWQGFRCGASSQQLAAILEHREPRPSLIALCAADLKTCRRQWGWRRWRKALSSQARRCRTGRDAFADGRENGHVVNRLTGSG